MKLIVLIFSLYISETSCFAALEPSGKWNRKLESRLTLKAERQPGTAFLGILATSAVFSLASPSAVAHNYQQNYMSVPSSIQIAETIKTLDMSLPSYNEISDSKASVENVKSLSVDEPTKALASTMKSRKKVDVKSDETEPNPALKAILPSMGKQSAEGKAAASSAEFTPSKPSSKVPGYNF